MFSANQFVWLFLAIAVASNAADWSTWTPRPEISPKFSENETRDVLAIDADDRGGQAGCWTSRIAITGGQWYRFTALRRTHQIASPIRSTPSRVIWLNADGQKALLDRSETKTLRPGVLSRSEPEYPMIERTRADGWTEVTDTFQAPGQAVAAQLELHLRWASQARVEWREIALTPIAAPTARIVRLATVRFIPKGESPAANREAYAPLVAAAARQKADLIVLGETLTQTGTRLALVDLAESIPGPTTDYFASLARKHRLHIVAGLVEKSGHLVYNASVLLGPDGTLIGKYRKVALPRTEVEAGLQPGSEYPVFETSLGRIGMMICYDGFFPEVARRLALNGAEVVAWPVAGCNPLLASARACENHVYLVSSSYSDAEPNWMPSAIYDHEGQIIARPEKPGSVVVAEVNLTRRLHWYSLGDFKAEWPRLMPERSGESGF